MRLPAFKTTSLSKGYFLTDYRIPGSQLRNTFQIHIYQPYAFVANYGLLFVRQADAILSPMQDFFGV